MYERTNGERRKHECSIKPKIRSSKKVIREIVLGESTSVSRVQLAQQTYSLLSVFTLCMPVILVRSLSIEWKLTLWLGHCYDKSCELREDFLMKLNSKEKKKKAKKIFSENDFMIRKQRKEKNFCEIWRKIISWKEFFVCGIK